MSKLFLTLLLSCSCIYGMQQGNTILTIDRSKIHAAEKLGKLAVVHKQGQFLIMRAGKKHTIPNENLDKELRNLPQNKLVSLLHENHLSINKMSNGNYAIRAFKKKGDT